MEMSDSLDQIAPAIIRAHKAVKPLVKNKDGYNYRYADMDQVLDAIQEALDANGLTIVQHPANDIERSGVESVLLHESGQYFRARFTTVPEKKDPQSIGSLITYYRRYAVMALMRLAPEDDDGQAASINNTASNSQPVQEFNIDGRTPLFGKYKGQRLGQVDAVRCHSWIQWIMEQPNCKREDVVKLKAMQNWLVANNPKLF